MTAGIVAASAVLSTGSGYSAAVLADSPLAYFRLDETSGTTLTDSSGNAHNGTYVSPTLGVTGATSDGDKAATFNGTSAYAFAAGGGAAWVPTHASSWTFECWAKFTSTGFAGLATIRTPSPFADSGITCNITIGRTAGRIGAETWDWANSGSRVISSANNNDGNWHHVAVTFDQPTNTLKLYIDGSLNDTKTQGTTGGAGNRQVTLAANNGGTSQWFPGSLDEFAVYGAALSAARIAAHYAAA